MTEQSAPVCPRCESSATKVRFESPVAGVWTLYGCDDCLFIWRSTELETITNPKLYPARFKVKLEHLKDIPVMPAIAHADT
jgi:vanillate/4-hydroxybenzoate decarboxylase subunit D